MGLPQTKHLGGGGEYAESTYHPFLSVSSSSWSESLCSKPIRLINLLSFQLFIQSSASSVGRAAQQSSGERECPVLLVEQQVLDRVEA